MQRSMTTAIPTIASFAAGMAAAVAAPLSLAAAMQAGITASSEWEQSFLRLEAVLKATGGTAGLTAREIATLAEEMERSTLNSSEAVNEAAASLATFRSVSGEAFTDAIRLAADMSAVFGGSLVSSATQLGKALEDPIQGLTALRRVGVTFSQDQKDVIEALVETGEAAEAQRLILEALEQQVGGAAEGQAGGLAGAFHRAAAGVGDLLQSLTETSGLAGYLTEQMNALGRESDRLAGQIAGPQTALQRLAETTVELDQARARLEALESSGRQGVQARLEEERANVARLAEEYERLREAYIADVRERGAARRAAEENAAAAQAEADAARERAAAEEAAEEAAKKAARQAEAAANAAEKLAERQTKAVADAELQADQQARLRAALEESVPAYEAVADAIEVENALRAVNLDALSAEGQALAEAIGRRQAEAEAIEEVSAARARLARLEDESRRRLEDRGFNPESSAADYRRGQEQSQADNAREAERMAQIYTDVFARAVDRIGETFSDTLAEYRNGELDNFEDFAASIGDIMAAPFEQLSGAVFSSLFEGIVADLSTQIKSAAASGQFDIAGLAGAFNNPLGAAALGASIGGIGAQALGIGNQYTSLGGGLGSGLGFAAGTALFGPAGGIAGGILGGILGTGIASTFGGGGQRDNVGTSVFLDDLRVNAGGTPNQNTSRAEQIGAQVAGVIQGLRSQGIEFDAGGKIRFNVNNTRSDADILQGATRQLRELSQTDDPLLRQVLEASSAKSPTALLGDIEFARFFEQLTGAAGPAEEALRALNVQFDEAARRARELGLDEAALAAAREEATRDLVRSTEDAVLAQADQIRAIFDARTGPLQSAIDSITIGTDSALSTQEQLDLVRSQFDALVAEADAGRDIDFNRLAGLGQQVVGLSREFDASGALFQEAFRDVNSTLQRVIEEQTGRQDDLLSALPDALRDAQRDQTAALAERLDKMVGELERLTRTVEIQGRVA